MFDFVNSTYSAIISVLSTLFGLSYPLIIGCIEKIDDKYGSTKLTDRFKQESVFKTFQYWLITNILVAIFFPFLMDGCIYSRWLIAFQCIIAIIMVYKAFYLFSLIMKYYDAKTLMEFIQHDFEQALDSKNKQKEAVFFTQWSDLTTVLINSADGNLVQSVYDQWYNYVLTKRNEYKNKPIEYDDYFYEGITRLNENLCKSERRLISVNNSNTLLTSLIDGNSYITDKTYNILWKNLHLQLFYGREDLIMEYWKCASQKFELFLRELYACDINEENQKSYKEEEMILRKKQRMIFLEFHIMLCSMLIQEKKYNLIEQMLLFSKSLPPSYPLVPSKISDILQWFINLNTKEFDDILYYEQRYPMPNMHGITGGKIIDAVNCYLALLIYRLYTIHWIYGKNYILNIESLPKSQKGLDGLKNLLTTLEFWLTNVYKDKKLLKTIHLLNFKERLQTLKNQMKDEQIPTPSEIIEKLERKIETTIDQKIVNQPLDGRIIKKEMNEVKENLKKSMKPYLDFIKSLNQGAKSYNLNSSETLLYSNTAFQEDSAISHVGIADSMFNNIWRNFTHFFSTAFYHEHANINYRIDSSILFNVIDKLIGQSNEYLIICFGVYLDYYLDQVGGLKKIVNQKYIYNKTTILSLYSPSKVFSQRIYIMKKNQIPKLSFNEYKKTDLNEIHKEYGLWMNVIKIKDLNNNSPENTIEKLGDDKDKNCLFIAYWNPILHFSSEIKMTCLKVNYKMNDEGNWDSLDNIKPL